MSDDRASSDPRPAERVDICLHGGFGPEPETRSVHPIQRLVRGRPMVCVVLLVLTMALGAVFVFARHQPTYISTGTIQIRPANVHAMDQRTDVPIGQNYSQFMATQQTLIGSRPMLQRAFDEHLRQNPRFAERVEDWTPRNLAGRLTVTVPRRTQLLHVRCQYSDPQLAQAIVDAVMQTYLNALHQGVVDNDLHRLRRTETELAELQAKRQALRQALIEKRVAMSRATYRRDHLMQQTQRPAQTPPQPAPSPRQVVQQDPAMRQYAAELREAKLRYQQQRERFSPRHQAMRQLDQRIAMLERLIQTRRGDLLAELAEQPESPEPSQLPPAETNREAELARTLEAIAQLELEVATEQQQLDDVQDSIAQLTARADQLRSRSGLDGQVAVVEPADLPAQPTGRGLAKNMILGSMFGSMGGLVLLVLLCRFDPACHFVEQLDDELPEAPVLGELEQAAGDDTLALARLAQSVHRIRMKLQAGGLGVARHVALVTAAEPGAGSTMAAAALGASFAAAGQRCLLIDMDRRGRTLSRLLGHASQRSFEDVLRESGKVTDEQLAEARRQFEKREHTLRHTMTDLGYPMQQIQHVVTQQVQRKRNQMFYETVVDMDLIPPVEAQLMIQTCRNQPHGLSDALEGMALRHSVVKTERPNLELLPINDNSRADDSSIRVEGLAKLLANVRADYDVVIIDAPPPDESMVSMLIASYVDQVVMMLPRGGHMRRARRIVTTFQQHEHLRLNTVFNRHGRRSPDQTTDALVQCVTHMIQPDDAQAKPVSAAA